VAAAAALAAEADYAIVFVGTLSHEGGDRASLSLDDGCTPSGGNIGSQCEGNNNNQNALVAAVAKANAKTTVVLSVPGAILLPWINDVSAALTNFMPGQQAGHAIADVLFGKVNPSAKLPVTFPNKEGEQLTSPEQWPGLPDPKNPVYANYTEKLLVGYRWYDANSVSFTTGFPFGHGLSYTAFDIDDLKVDAPNKAMSVQVTNTGKVAGAEVVQVYVSLPEHVSGGVVKQLKDFKKVTIQPGSSARVNFDMSSYMQYWDVSTHSWAVATGNYTVSVGSSSRDIRAKASWQRA
jgi:beta-glucosidase